MQGKSPFLLDFCDHPIFLLVRSWVGRAGALCDVALRSESAWRFSLRVTYGQAERSSATLDDLLSEIRGLRADLGQQSSATLRTQLLVARLTLQEQRINALGGQLNETR